MSESTKKTQTTAGFLALFYKELIRDGITEETANRLVLSAAQSLFENDGITVKGEE